MLDPKNLVIIDSTPDTGSQQPQESQVSQESITPASQDVENQPSQNVQPPLDSTTGNTEITPSDTKAPPSTPTFTESDLIQYLNTNIGDTQFNSIDEIREIIQTKQRLQEELQNKKLEFPNERAKALYEFATKHDGNELSAAENYLRAIRLDVNNTDAKTLQFEAFALENPKLSREKAKAIFEARYEKTYGDGTFEDPSLEYEHDLATEKAKQSIKSVIDSYVNAKQEPLQEPTGPTEEQRIAVKNAIESALKDFKGIKVPLNEYKTTYGTIAPGEITVPIEPAELNKFKQYLLDPQSWFNNLLDGFTDKNTGQINWNAYRDTMFNMTYGQKIAEQRRAQDIERTMKHVLEHMNNTRIAKDTPSTLPPSKPKSIHELAANAVQNFMNSKGS